MFEQIHLNLKYDGTGVELATVRKAMQRMDGCRIPDVLFLLDEPESHFNPQWRVKFISRLLDLPNRKRFSPR